MGNTQIIPEKETTRSTARISRSLIRTRSIRAQLKKKFEGLLDEDNSHLSQMEPQTGGGFLPQDHLTSNDEMDESSDDDWGFFVDISPPSEEMYPRQPFQSQQSQTVSFNTPSPATAEKFKTRRPPTRPNPVFLSLPSQRANRATRLAMKM